MNCLSNIKRTAAFRTILAWAVATTAGFFADAAEPVSNSLLAVVERLASQRSDAPLSVGERQATLTQFAVDMILDGANFSDPEIKLVADLGSVLESVVPSASPHEREFFVEQYMLARQQTPQWMTGLYVKYQATKDLPASRSLQSFSPTARRALALFAALELIRMGGSIQDSGQWELPQTLQGAGAWSESSGVDLEDIERLLDRSMLELFASPAHFVSVVERWRSQLAPHSDWPGGSGAIFAILEEVMFEWSGGSSFSATLDEINERLDELIGDAAAPAEQLAATNEALSAQAATLGQQIEALEQRLAGGRHKCDFSSVGPKKGDTIH